jgi:hypothetical protein
MSVTAAIFPAAVYPNTIPFCDKKFQKMRVVADFVNRICLALIYKIVHVATWLFSAEVSHRYHSLAKYEFYRCGTLFDFIDYGGEIVDFSTNCFPRVKERLPKDVTELDRLRQIYGADKVDHLYREYPWKHLVERREITSGCCWGMSMDFISSYLQQLDEGMTPLEAVRHIAPHFVEGASDRAQLAHIFFPYSGPGKNREDFFRIVEEMAEANEDQLEKSRLDFYKSTVVLNDAFHLHAEESSVHVMKNYDKSVAQAPFEDFVDGLPAGCYEMTIYFSKGDLAKTKGHSIAWIKTDEETNFIFDSNIGTLAVASDQSAARLWKILGKYVKKDNWILFTPCTRA